ncbi:MAG: tetratricopeptide repeat protein [Gemmatimonadota bacterium]
MTNPSEAAVAEQLSRIIASPMFERADRLKRFLEFIVGEAVAGRAGALKEYTVATRVFGKETAFDPRTDPIVRVQARRLRAKLQRYYATEGAADPLVIDLPRGGYGPVIRPSTAPSSTHRAVRASLLGRNTITVQHFADLSSDRSLSAITAGLREEIIHRLSDLTTLRISAVPTGADDFNDHEHAALLIGGSVRCGADRLRVHVHLIDGATNTYLWTDAIDGPVTDPIAIQERAAVAVRAQLDGKARGAGSVHARPAANLAAQNFYRQGRYHLDQRTEEGLTRAVTFFERAIGEDAQYAQAHAGLADAFGLLAHYGALGPADAWPSAASAAETAVMLDDLSAEAHTSLAHVRATQDWDWHAAEEGFRRAIERDPQYTTAHHWYATSCLVPLGRLDEAREEMIVAQSLDPVSSIVARDLAMIHYYRRDYDAALEQCDHTIELNPHFAPAYWSLGIVQEQLGDPDESAAAFQRAVLLSPRTPRLIGSLGRALALAGREEEAIAERTALEQRAADRYVSPLEFGWIELGLGNVDVAFRWLTEAFDERAFDLIAAHVDPRFDVIRNDERFVALASRLGLGA